MRIHLAGPVAWDYARASAAALLLGCGAPKDNGRHAPDEGGVANGDITSQRPSRSLAVAAPPLPFSVSLIPDRDRLVIALRGELDIATAPRLAAALAECQGDGWQHITLDLRDVSFMDTAAIHAILDARQAAPDCRLEVIEGSGVSRIIALTQLAETVTVVRAQGG